MTNKARFSTAVLILSILCSLLIGFIAGYFIANFLLSKSAFNFMATRSITGSSYKYEPMERKDIVYYRPGNDDLWRDNYKQIPEGNGSIVGKIFINDNPAKDLEFSLILASGQKTKKTKVNIEGDYNISLPKGKY